MSQPQRASFLAPGRNCWRLERAEKVSFLVDADSYFHAFREAVKLARKTVFICGWDIDSRLALLRDDPHDGYPILLRDFLNAVAGRKKDLQIHILIWDFAMFIGLNREWFPIYKLDWKTHRNIHLDMDSLHPLGASHHQKIVVIDDVLAFAGGLDLTKKRWDTPAHTPDDKRRRTPGGEFYRPHHDVQIMVSGKTAADLGDFIRERWRLISRRSIPGRSHGSGADIWPDRIRPDIVDCDVGIARTRARYNELSQIQEVERLFLDSISRAQNYLYIENQYLTAPKISRALAESLRLDEGPEIIIILPLTTDGWLSQHTMDVLRKRAVHEMREADRHNRLGVFYAHQEGLSDEDSLKIHAKLMIADDVFVRIGSANLNNRSLGLDTECDLALEAGETPAQKEAVAHFCHRLLAEHLGVKINDIRKTREETGSLLQTIRRLQGNDRTLKNLEVQLDGAVELMAEEQDLLDPEKPIEPERLVEQWLPLEKPDGRGIGMAGPVLLIIAGIALALAWRFTPLHDLISGEQLLRLVGFLKTAKLAWLYVIAAYVFGSLLIAPITVLITLTVLIYGSIKGFLLAILGSCVNGAITYWLGRILGRGTVRRLAGDTANRISERLGRSGILSTFIIRLVPIAPYSIVNIVAGATHIRFRDFMLGTVLGMLPGTLAIAGLVDRGFAVFQDPGPVTAAGLAVVVALIAAGYFFIQRKLR